MKVLGIDTFGEITSIAIYGEDGLIFSQKDKRNISHSRKILPLIDLLLKKTGISLKDISGFGISTGPGSFTGLRIGIATGIGLALAKKSPVVSVSTLYALAQTALIHSKSRFKLICPIIDARRDEVYFSVYSYSSNNTLINRSGEMVSSPVEIKGYIQPGENVLFYGSGEAYRYAFDNILKKQANFIPYGTLSPLAEKIAELAYFKLKTKGGDRANKINANYIRRSDAEMNFNK